MAVFVDWAVEDWALWYFMVLASLASMTLAAYAWASIMWGFGQRCFGSEPHDRHRGDIFTSLTMIAIAWPVALVVCTGIVILYAFGHVLHNFVDGQRADRDMEEI